MIKLLLTTLAVHLLTVSFAQDNNYKIENAQERLATRIVKEIEKNNIDSIYKYLDPAYLKAKLTTLKTKLAKFYTDYKTLGPETKRYTSLSFPAGYNDFAFRYIDSTGTVLQINLSFRKDDINSNVLLVETIDKLTFKKQREKSSGQPTVIIEGASKQKYPYTTTFMLRNCSKEMRTVTFGSPTDFFKWWVFGNVSLANNKVVFFAKNYKPDTAWLQRNIDSIKRSLPKKFWTFPMGEQWFDNEPNEEAIWFIKIFAQVDKAENIKIFAAYKIVFEGTDARIDNQRRDPKIRDIQFILDKESLRALEKKLKSSPQAGY